MDCVYDFSSKSLASAGVSELFLSTRGAQNTISSFYFTGAQLENVNALVFSNSDKRLIGWWMHQVFIFVTVQVQKLRICFSSVCVVVFERGKFSLDCSMYCLFTLHIFFWGGDRNLVKMAMCDKIFMRIHYVIGKRMN